MQTNVPGSGSCQKKITTGVFSVNHITFNKACPFLEDKAEQKALCGIIGASRDTEATVPHEAAGFPSGLPPCDTSHSQAGDLLLGRKRMMKHKRTSTPQLPMSADTLSLHRRGTDERSYKRQNREVLSVVLSDSHFNTAELPVLES